MDEISETTFFVVLLDMILDAVATFNVAYPREGLPMPRTKPGMKSTLLRQWKMLRMIPRLPRKIGTADLMQRLEEADFTIDLRTIQRDLNQLSEVLPLTSDQAKPQGWAWKEAAEQFDIPGMEPQVALAFHMAEVHLRSLLPASTVDTLKPWFSAANRVLDEHGNGISHWPEKIRVLPRGLPQKAPGVDADVQAKVYQAVLQERQLQISYGREPNDWRDYLIHPIALVVRNQVIYLVCVFDGFDDIRQLAMQRIRFADVLGLPAVKPADFVLDDYIAQGAFGLVFRDEPLSLEARFMGHLAIHLRETPIAEDQVIEEIDQNFFRLTASVPDTLELRLWLKSFGDEVEVLGPPALREEFTGQAKRMAKLYR